MPPAFKSWRLAVEAVRPGGQNLFGARQSGSRVQAENRAARNSRGGTRKEPEQGGGNKEKRATRADDDSGCRARRPWINGSASDGEEDFLAAEEIGIEDDQLGAAVVLGCL